MKERPETEGRPEADVKVGQPVMSRELSDFLIQLSIAVHRFGMYPAGHPSLRPAAEAVIDRLPRLLEERESLAIGVASGQLIIEGIATVATNPVMGDLARRLHGHQIGAISIDRGATVSEVEEACRTLAAETARDAQPLGLLPRDEIPDWDHFHLYPLGYERLVLKEPGEGGTEGVSVDRATELWLGLARSAMAGEVDAADGPPSPQAIADSIRRHRKEAAYDQMIVGHLLQLTEELKKGEGESAQIKAQVSDLIGELDDPTLQRLVDMGGDFGQRKRFVLDASQGLAADAVMKVLQAAAVNSRQTISHSMTRLMTKLAVHSEGGDPTMKSGVGDALQENVEELISEWELADPNPDSYTLLLDEMSRAAPVLKGEHGEDTGRRALTGGARLVEMALEVGAFGPTVEKAIIDLLEQGHVRFILDVVGEAVDSGAARQIVDFVATPRQLGRLLSADEVDVDSLNAIVLRMGSAALDPLLDALADADSKDRRQLLLDTLARFGQDVWQGVRLRLEHPQWWVIRNMLLLVQMLDEVPDEFDAMEFLEHPDRRVRQEAFRLAVGTRQRQKVLARALADPDERIVRMALLELGESVPETLVPIVVNRVILPGDRSPEIRAFGIRALERTGSALVMETLLKMTVTGKTIFGRPILAPKSLEVLAAVHALAHGWPAEPRVIKLAKAAKRSKDPEIRAAGGAS